MTNAKPPEKLDLFVVARILERLWREREPMLRTHLQRAANVNWDVFSRYLSWLQSRDLVCLESSEDGHKRVRITPKGHGAYRRLVEWLNEFVRSSKP